MKFFVSIVVMFTTIFSFAAVPHPTVGTHREIAKKTNPEELRRLAREIEVLADWKDAPAFLQMSKRILKLYELDQAKSAFAATTELKDLADIYRDGTVPPELFFIRAKILAQSIQTYLQANSSKKK